MTGLLPLDGIVTIANKPVAFSLFSLGFLALLAVAIRLGKHDKVDRINCFFSGGESQGKMHASLAVVLELRRSTTCVLNMIFSLARIWQCRVRIVASLASLHLNDRVKGRAIICSGSTHNGARSVLRYPPGRCYNVKILLKIL